MGHQISIVIPSLRKANKTLECLKPLLKKRDYEVIITTVANVSRARNVGAQKAKGDVLLFMEDDLKVDPNELHNFIINHLPVEDEIVTCPYILTWVCGGRLLLIRKNTFKKLRGFNEHISFGGEVYDFGMRALRKGVEIKRYRVFFEHLGKSDKPLLKEMKRRFYEVYNYIKYKRHYYNNLWFFWIRDKPRYVMVLIKIVSFFYHQLYFLRQK